MELLHTDMLNAVNDYLSGRVGLFFNQMRFADLQRGLKMTGQELGYADDAAFIESLTRDELSKAQLQILVRNLTIGETYFFRDPPVFLSLEEKIIPDIISRKKVKNLRIWSAGCSSGEEPYSVAISLLRSLDGLESYNLSLLATDINTMSLDKGRKAQYSNWSFRTMPAEFMRTYFNRIEDGQMQLHERIRRMVRFDYLNLAEDNYPSLESNTSSMDIVFCRNVLIYFTQSKSKEIVDKLSDSLIPGGYLVMSANDSARLIATPLKNLERISATIFRKYLNETGEDYEL